MDARLNVDPTLPVPIWSQIEDAMRRLVACGAMRPGVLVPSVRDLARQLRVNPNTVAKAYQRLVDAGVFESRRGEGTFVAAHPPSMSAGERERELREGASRLAALAVTLGCTRAQAAAALQASWPEGEPSPRGGKRS
ncbi:MAG TPA: GntR family transcriptional regulator [Vicinamibacteria bacterium]|nr:GntR family transcriptional regulator [Vicinamibacteria bacterium]